MPALANDHRIPRVDVRVNGKSERIHPWTYSWTDREGVYCRTIHADGVPSYRPRMRVDHLHATPRIVFHKRQRPRNVRVRAYRSPHDGYPAGDGEAIDTAVRPRRRDGEIVTWVARFRIGVVFRRQIEVDATWRDEEGCGGTESGSWSFGLERAFV